MAEHHGSRTDTLLPAAAALDALLRGNPAIQVAALSSEGVMEPVPDSVPRHGQAAYDGAIGIDLLIPEDRVLILNGWARAAAEPVVSFAVRLLGDPDQPVQAHFFDVRAEYGVHVVVLEADPELVRRSQERRDERRGTVGHVERDALGVFLAVDPGFSALLGWSAEELIGHRTVDLIHPDDIERALEGWMAMRAGVGSGRTRARYRHKLGHHVWIEVTNHNRLDDPAVGRVLSELVDVTDEMAQLDALRDRERLLARLAEALPIGVCHVRIDNQVVYANEPLTALLGTIGRRDDLVRSASSKSHQALVAAALDAAMHGEAGDLEVDVVHDAGPRRCELTFRPMTADNGTIDGVIVCAADVTDRSRLRAELEHRANHDSLSGCLNRAATVSALERALRTAPRVAVAFIDLDGLKVINDSLGHATGDELLRITARRLRGAIRSEDRLGRIGGDEFVVICPLAQGHPDPDELVRRLTSSVNSDAWITDRRIPLQASVGLAMSHPGELDPEAVLSRADAAMYQVKERRSSTAPTMVLETNGRGAGVMAEREEWASTDGTG